MQGRQAGQASICRIGSRDLQPLSLEGAALNMLSNSRSPSIWWFAARTATELPANTHLYSSSVRCRGILTIPGLPCKTATSDSFTQHRRSGLSHFPPGALPPPNECANGVSQARWRRKEKEGSFGESHRARRLVSRRFGQPFLFLNLSHCRFSTLSFTPRPPPKRWL